MYQTDISVLMIASVPFLGGLMALAFTVYLNQTVSSAAHSDPEFEGKEGTGYFERPFCQSELRWAKAAGKPAQPVVDAADKTRIGEFLGQAPDDLRDLGSIDFIELHTSDPDHWALSVQKVLLKLEEQLEESGGLMVAD